MKIQIEKYALLVVSIVLIVLVNIWMFQYPNTNETYYNLIFLNFKAFATYHLTELNFQYIMAFLLFHTIVIQITIGDLYDSDTFVSLVLHRSGSVQCYRMLCKNQWIKLMQCMLCTFVTIYGLLMIRIGMHVRWIETVKNVLYLVKYAITVFTLTSLLTFMILFQKTKYAMICIQGIFMFLVLVDCIMKTNVLTYSNAIQNELFGIVGVMIVYCIMYLIGMWLFKKRDLV